MKIDCRIIAFLVTSTVWIGSLLFICFVALLSDIQEGKTIQESFYIDSKKECISPNKNFEKYPKLKTAFCVLEKVRPLANNLFTIFWVLFFLFIIPMASYYWFDVDDWIKEWKTTNQTK